MRSDNDKQPLLSVIMPAYNCQKYVSLAINSILGQTFERFELIVTDDGSTDRTREIIDSFDDRRIIRSHNEMNLGKVRTVNRSIEMCRGEFITIHDADDWSEEIRFEIFIDFFENNPEYVLAGSSYNNVNEKDRLISVSHMEYGYDIIKENIGKSNKIHGPTIFFNRIIPDKVDGLYRNIKMGEDIDFIWRVGEKFKITNIQQVLYNYRIHPQSMTKNFKHNLRNKIRDRYVIYSLAKQRKLEGTDFLIQRDEIGYANLLNQIEIDYRKNSFKYINEYASYLLNYQLKLNAIKFLLYNIFQEGFSFKKLKLLIYIFFIK